MGIRTDNEAMTNSLKDRYKLLVETLDSAQHLDVISLSLPKLCAPYQFHYHDLLKEFHIEQDKQDEYYHNLVFNIKSGTSKLSMINLGASEMKKMIETDLKYREFQRNLDTIQEEMKLVEEMLSTLKQFGFNISNSIKYRDMVGGAR